MTIDEAIKRLSKAKGWAIDDESARDEEAILLSIEALQRCKYLEEHTTRWADVLLPGETKD